MDNKKTYNRYQWSIMIGPEQYVAREDDPDVFRAVVGDLRDMVKQDHLTPEPSSPTPSSQQEEFVKKIGENKIEELEDAPMDCVDHPGKRLWHKTGKYGPFWSHKNEDGSYHNIKG